MKMCKTCHRIIPDKDTECKCGSIDLANINDDWINDWITENADDKNSAKKQRRTA